MSDKIWRWHVTGLIRYNHTLGTQYYVIGTEPPIAGLNQLYGDGSVHWKGRNELNTAAMTNPASYPDPFTVGTSNDADYF